MVQDHDDNATEDQSDDDDERPETPTEIPAYKTLEISSEVNNDGGEDKMSDTAMSMVETEDFMAPKDRDEDGEGEELMMKKRETMA